MANTLNLGNGNWATKEDSLLGYNSENNNFKPLPFDFTRASSATVVNKQGLIETVGSGEPRIDFLGNTNGALKLEPQRTNLITQSNDFDTQSKQNVTVTSDAIISPDGSLNADKLVENSANSSHYLRINTSSSSASVISVFAKKGEETKIFIGNANFSQGVLFDLDLGVIESGSDGTIENYGNGWYKCSFYRTDLSAWQYISLRGNFTTYQGNGVNGVYLYGLQLEDGTYPSSLINTQGSTVTRLADFCNNGGNEQVFNSLEGVLYINTAALTQSGGNRWISIHDNTGNNDIELRYTSNTNQIRCKYVIGSVAIADVFFTVTDATQFSKIAFKWASADFALWIDGVEVATSLTGATSNIAFDELSFDVSNLGSTNFYGNTKDVRVYTTALTDNELAILTTL